MKNEIDFTFKDNSGIIRQAMEENKDALLEALGIQGHKHVVDAITESGHVDTGLMRNSIAWAISGEAPNVRSYHADKANKSGTQQGVGFYSGTAPDAQNGQKAVYIGSNLPYFVPQELGYHTSKGTSVPGIHSLQTGISKLQVEAERIAQTIFEDMGG